MNPFSLLKTAIATLIGNKATLYPYALLFFLYMIALEVLYFIPLEPLRAFFGPIVEKLFGEIFMHYPYNMNLIPKLFQYAQIVIFVFFGAFLIPTSMQLVVQINNEDEYSLKKAFGVAARNYVYILIALIILVACLLWKIELLNLIVERASRIRSTTGMFAVIKSVILQGASYWNILMDVFVQSLFVMILPIVIVFKRKIFTAVFVNIKLLFKYWWIVFIIALIPSFLYLPVLILRNVSAFTDVFPEITPLLLAISAFLSVIIDAVIYTSITILCLLKKDLR